MATLLVRFTPTILAVFTAVLNQFAPDIGQVVTAHPDLALAGYALLTGIANAIHPTAAPAAPELTSILS